MGLQLGTTTRRLDVAAIEQGVEKECPDRPGLFVRILPASPYNPRYRAAIENRALRVTENGQEPPSFVEMFDDAEFVTEALVADMRGIRDETGAEVTYTPELGAQILSAPEHQDVREWIGRESLRRGQYYTESVEDRKGN